MERLVEWNCKEKNSALPKCINEIGDTVYIEDICAQIATIYDIVGDMSMDRLRELVEKVPRCEHCKDGKSFDGQVVIMGNKGMFPLNFCPRCGSPLTDEAVQMVMERMEKLKNADTNY